jgi:CheY-like chemotaxis protein
MILLFHVEDDVDIREIVKMSLEISGEFDVVQFASGEEALAKLAHQTPDVVLLDLMMPGMSGMHTLVRMREMFHLADVPTVFMTARTRQAEQDDLRAAGAVSVISKPFDPLTLASQMKAILQG